VKKDRKGCKKRQTRRSKTTRKGNKKDRQWGVKRQAKGREYKKTGKGRKKTDKKLYNYSQSAGQKDAKGV
jgi:hypothetical protein